MSGIDELYRRRCTVPVTVPGRRGDTIFNRDEHIRPDTNPETLARLRPILGRDDPHATVTAGNASGQNDGAAIYIVTTPDKAAELGLRPLLRLVTWAIAGVPPATMGIGPVLATAKALHNAGLTLADIDLIGLNEAFAAQTLAVTREWTLTPGDFDRLNVNGSGISLGHPVGATGGRILANPRPRNAPTGRPVRPGNHVHRRRPRHRIDIRDGQMTKPVRRADRCRLDPVD